MRAIVSSSGTSSPEARIGATWRPSSVSSAIAALNMSPVETWGTPWVARDPLRLGAFPGALRPEDEDVDRSYLRKPS